MQILKERFTVRIGEAYPGYFNTDTLNQVRPAFKDSIDLIFIVDLGKQALGLACKPFDLLFPGDFDPLRPVVLNGQIAYQIDVGSSHSKPCLKNRSGFSGGAVVNGQKIPGAFIRYEELLKREEGVKPMALMGKDQIIPVVYGQ